MVFFLGSLFIIITNPPKNTSLSPGFRLFNQIFFPVARFLCYLIDCGPAFGVFEFVRRRNRLFVHPLFFNNNISQNIQRFLSFRLFDPIFFPVASYCNYLIDSGPAFWVFKFVRRQNRHFRPNYGRNFLYFLKHPKISEFSTFRPNFFSCGKLLSLSNRFRTGFLGFQIRPSSKSSFSAELWSKFSIFLKTAKDF